jgi:hypothetical protein
VEGEEKEEEDIPPHDLFLYSVIKEEKGYMGSVKFWDGVSAEDGRCCSASHQYNENVSTSALFSVHDT